MAAPQLPRKLWEHPNPKGTDMYRFMQEANRTYGLQLETFRELYRWSCDQRSQFYGLLFDWAGIIHEGSYARVVDEEAPIDSIPRWFEGVRLNFAENLLYSRGRADGPGHRGTAGKEDDKVAVTEVREGGGEVVEVTWGELRRRAGALAGAMKARGVSRGDRVVLVGANSADAALVLVAATWLGAVFSSSSTDMGVAGILQRTTQIDPRLVFFDDAALYNGRRIDLRDKMADVSRGMAASCPGFRGVVAIPRWRDAPLDVSGVPGAETLSSFLRSTSSTSPPPPFARVDFHDPFLVCYSSGTTGIPKAIVHAVGNVTLSLVKEGRLHEGAGPASAGLQYTTTGWIMYLSGVAQLVLGARAILYDGSPLWPDAGVLVRAAAAHRATKLGVSPRWLAEVARAGLVPREHADLSALETVTTTGMVLPDDLFEWFYDVAFPPRVHLANISGGTDIAGCFGQQNPLTPVRVGGTQGPSLGVAVAVFDTDTPEGEPGRPVPDGEPGELVAVSAFPNIPVRLWGDDATSASPTPGPRSHAAPPGSRYHAAYFARFAHAWAHGDFVSLDPATGALSFLGRADGVLNPSGVRFGSAEVYAVVDRLFADRVADSLCVGRRRPSDADETVMLFLLMRPGCRFDDALAAEVRAAIGRELTKRHVPPFVFETPEIPTTVNLKKVELPVKHIVSGRTVKPSGTLLNPQSLDFYYQFARVELPAPPRGKL